MDTNEQIENRKEIKTKKPKDKKLVTGIIVFIIGLATLVGGLVFMLLNIFAEPGVRDAEYLVQVGQWVREDETAVIWNFTEIGKGTLTTNNHQNDYEFIWAMEDDELKIETDWLYDLENEYEYKLDQSKNTLVLTNGDDNWTFVPATLENE